jgi:predicted TIM-barrel fold metal-dependent hydrolase
MSELIGSLVDGYRRDLQRQEFFDLNAWCGLVPSNGFYRPESWEQIIRDLRQHGISRAVVSSAQCLEYDALQGNESIARLIADQPSLFGAMVLVPDLALPVGAGLHYIDEKVEQGFVIARMFPKKLNHSMRKWQVGSILAHLEHRHLPLMLWHNEVTWDLVESICQEYPELPVIIEGNDVKLLYHNRNYLALLTSHPNFYLETHNLVLYSEIETLAGIAPDNLLFGTYFPYNNPHVSLFPILRARLPDEVIDKLAVRNLEQLLGQIR